MRPKGGVTILLFHCIFHGYDSITYVMHDSPLGLYAALPNTYAICVADNTQLPRKIVAGFFVKTSYHHDDTEFGTALLGATMHVPALAALCDAHASLLPARLPNEGKRVLSEDDMLRVLLTQSLKFSSAGSA